MAIKRKSRSTTSNRRRTRRRVMNVPRRRSMISNDVHHFKRTAELIPIQGATASGVPIDTLGSLVFSIGLVPNVSEFSQLYDMYKINGIKLKLVPAQTGSDLNAPATAQYMPDLWTVIDYDDGNTPTKNDLLQYPGLKVTRGNQVHSRYFKPAVSAEIYRSAVTTSYAPKWKQWLDFAVTDVPHYGIKYFAHAASSAAGLPPAWRCYATFYFSCRGVR